MALLRRARLGHLLTTRATRNTVGIMVRRPAVALATLLLACACASTEDLSSSDLGDSGEGSGGDTTSGGAAGDANSDGATGGGWSSAGGSPQGGSGGGSGPAGSGGGSSGGTSTGGTSTGGGSTGGSGGTPQPEMCTGTATACNFLAGAQCTAALGCTDSGLCTEPLQLCASASALAECLLLAVTFGCQWGAVGGTTRCYAPCELVTDATSCANLGCQFSSACSGTVTPCAGLTPPAACDTQPGCIWQ